MAQRQKVEVVNTEVPTQPSKKSATRIKSDFPKITLAEALRVALTIENKAGGQPLPPLDMAMALESSPGSSVFRDLLSHSIKYGLTSGSYNGEKVSIEGLGRGIVEPVSPEKKQESLTTAALNPPTFQAIFDYYKGKKLPDSPFFQNTIIRELSVPKEHADKCAEIFIKNMEHVGLLENLNGSRWLRGSVSRFASVKPESSLIEDGDEVENMEEELSNGTLHLHLNQERKLHVVKDEKVVVNNNRVFITHGKNKEILAQMKELLSFGNFVPVIAQENETVSKPVPDKVMQDMRSCYASIIHVGTDRKVIDQDGNEHRMLNENVLIEIGASMALYEGRFILLVERGTKLPSNLSGLYEVRYEGGKLDYEATMKLLKAFNDFKPRI